MLLFVVFSDECDADRAKQQQNSLFACGMDEFAQDTSKGALYLTKLLEAGKIKAVTGHGKGKYIVK